MNNFKTVQGQILIGPHHLKMVILNLLSCYLQDLIKLLLLNKKASVQGTYRHQGYRQESRAEIKYIVHSHFSVYRQKVIVELIRVYRGFESTTHPYM